MKMMDLKEFRDKGYLHEVNRLFFHRMGLALVVAINHEGQVILTGIMDVREDEEGVVFAEDLMDKTKIKFIEEELKKKKGKRASLSYCNSDGIQIEPAPPLIEE